MGEIVKRGFEEICFSLTKEAFRFRSASCSCIFELFEAVGISRIFFPKLEFFAYFLYISSREEQQNCDGGGVGGG